MVTLVVNSVCSFLWYRKRIGIFSNVYLRSRVLYAIYVSYSVYVYVRNVHVHIVWYKTSVIEDEIENELSAHDMWQAQLHEISDDSSDNEDSVLQKEELYEMVRGWIKSYHRNNCSYNYKDLKCGPPDRVREESIQSLLAFYGWISRWAY